MSRRKLLKALGAASTVALGAGVLGCAGKSSIDNALNNSGMAGNATYTITSTVRTGFAEYKPLLVSIDPGLADYSVDAGLSGVGGLDRVSLDAASRSALAKDLFYLRPSGDDQIYDLYKSAKDAGIPVFITTDAALHAYHILFDFTLRRIEADKLIPAAGELTDLMLSAALAQLNAGVPELQDACVKNVAFFGVATKLLGRSFKDSLPLAAGSLVDRELALIDAHEGFAPSPIFGFDEDYSQYVPRGHYTRSDALKQYFRAMMWYGRIPFYLYKSGPGPKVPDVEHTRQAILIALALKDRALDLWQLIYDPTVFFVGETDDLSVYDYGPLLREVYGSTVTLADLADDGRIRALIDKARDLRPPKIESTLVVEGSDADITKSFRFMGQRFIPDSYIFQGLVHDKVLDRYFPLGLDVMAVLGSQRAYDILDGLGETKYANYVKQFDALKAEFAALKGETWAQNLYWGWLYCLLALLGPKGDGYPSFMKGQAWADKDLNAALGSWAELRHDTILYAKQSYARLTALPIGGQARGYVEPDAELYARLAALAQMTRDGLSARGLLKGELEQKLTSLHDTLLRLKGIAEAELTGTALSDEDYSFIRNFGDTLEALTTFSPGTSADISNDADKKMAVIADVHTDPNSGQVLEEAVGSPYRIFVIAPVDGQLTLLQGSAFCYYEFKQPMSDRLTDEAWQDLLAGGRAPEPPAWTKSFRA